MLDTKLQEKLNQVNFKIDIRDIQGIPSEMGRKVVRLDNLGRQEGDPLGIVGSRYKPILHKDAFGGAIQAMQDGGLDFNNAKLDIETYENGGMAKMELLLPSHHTKVGEHDLYLKFVARNSYNAKWKFQSFFGWMNQVCFNTLVSGQKIAYTSNRHTTHFDVQESNLKIQNAVSAITEETKTFNKWWNTRVDDDKVAEMFTKTIAKSQASDSQVKYGSPETNKKQLMILMGLFEAEATQIHGRGDYGRNGAKGSLWCAYQSATAWSTHLGDYDKDAKKYIVQQRRQNDVRNMINSKSWKDLEVA
tara:strand:- start:234 stop:1145 length:912 start_codon:yes stop_codon:yes gene_type:complete